MLASAFLIVIGAMIAFFFLSGMDARMDQIGEKRGEPPAEEDREFTKIGGFYWIGVILLLGVLVGIAVVDFIATRKYWMARYKEIKADHEAKLQRDLAVFRQQKLNDRARGLKKPDDDTPPEGNEPLPYSTSRLFTARTRPRRQHASRAPEASANRRYSPM